MISGDHAEYAIGVVLVKHGPDPVATLRQHPDLLLGTLAIELQADQTNVPVSPADLKDAIGSRDLTPTFIKQP